MKVLVLFGSKSDEKVYGPFVDHLKEIYDVEFQVLSAHRNASELDALLAKDDFDIAVGGAGLSAHLPGVIASKTDKPVMGIPVSARMKGMDAFLSISQMPFGVPVSSCGPAKEDQILLFLKRLKEKKNEVQQYRNRINLVCREEMTDTPAFIKELERTKKYAEEKGIELTVTPTFSKNAFNIALVDEEKPVIYKEELCFHVPILSSELANSYECAVKTTEWATEGGMWLGVNNVRNAVISVNQIMDIIK